MDLMSQQVRGSVLPFIGGLGIPELLIILVIVIIIFGVGKLPAVGGALGKSIREFREQARPEDMEEEEGDGDVLASEQASDDSSEGKSSTSSDS